jgi:hypothetical protein
MEAGGVRGLPIGIREADHGPDIVVVGGNTEEVAGTVIRFHRPR